MSEEKSHFVKNGFSMDLTLVFEFVINSELYPNKEWMEPSERRIIIALRLSCHWKDISAPARRSPMAGREQGCKNNYISKMVASLPPLTSE